jgi:hypothetical protein
MCHLVSDVTWCNPAGGIGGGEGVAGAHRQDVVRLARRHLRLPTPHTAGRRLPAAGDSSETKTYGETKTLKRVGHPHAATAAAGTPAWGVPLLPGSPALMQPSVSTAWCHRGGSSSQSTWCLPKETPGCIMQLTPSLQGKDEAAGVAEQGGEALPARAATNNWLRNAKVHAWLSRRYRARTRWRG